MPDTPVGQRQKALGVVAGMPQGTVGAAIAPLLRVATSVFGDNCAGKVGDFYQLNKALLMQPATDANIEKFAEMETNFFRTQSGCTRFAGSLLSAQDRANLIKGKAKNKDAQ